MKLLRVLSAAAVSAALAATMVISASAATKDDVLTAAQNAGLPKSSEQYQRLSNFLEDPQNEFTSEEYQAMIDAAEDASAKYIAPIAERLFPGVALSDLTVEQLEAIVAEMSDADKQAIRDALVAVGEEVGVEISAGVDNATAKKKGNDNTGAADKQDDPVAPTGGVAEDTNSGAVAGAGLALVLAATGAVVVAKKNRA